MGKSMGTPRTAVFDPQTDRLLSILARKYDGNVSMALRYAVRQTAAAELARKQGAGNGQEAKG